MKIVLILVVIVAFLWMIWRLASKRYIIPCPTWLGWLVERDNPFTKVNRAATIIQHLNLKEGMSVLDVGCGPGRLAIPIATKVGSKGEVVAMDIQPGMLSRTQEKARAANLTNIKFLNAGIGENKLDRDKFDRVLLVTVLGEIPNQQAALKEVFDTLKPGGILSVTEVIFDPHFQRRNTVFKLANTVGFQEKGFFGNRIAYTLHLEKPQSNNIKSSIKSIKRKEELIQNPEAESSHIVLLGAGASRAAFPDGDSSGKSMPVMSDLINILNLNALFDEAGIKSSDNFETIYANINDNTIRENIEKRIYSYFSKLKLPDTATHYDRLLLSLRKKDAIFTFNWDPFLFDAYERNYGVASLPGIFFLHGNVRVGSCVNHPDNWGKRGQLCPTCNQRFVDVPLLYPIEKKNYFSGNSYTASSWDSAKSEFSKAFTMTIFGYSAPDSDVEAVDLLRSAWLNESSRELEHVELIDILDSAILHERWKTFTPTFHLHLKTSFEQSSLLRWPRRTCEAMYYPMSQGLPCEDFPLPETDDLNELHNAIKEISKYETE